MQFFQMFFPKTTNFFKGKPTPYALHLETCVAQQTDKYKISQS